jgi:hypothetical protein
VSSGVTSKLTVMCVLAGGFLHAYVKTHKSIFFKDFRRRNLDRIEVRRVDFSFTCPAWIPRDGPEVSSEVVEHEGG